MKLKLKPLGDRLIVRATEEEEATASTTEAIVAEVPEKEAAGAGAGMPDMSGMM